MIVASLPDIVSSDNSVLVPGFVRMYNGSAAALAAGDVVVIDLSVTTYGIGTSIKKSVAGAGGIDSTSLGIVGAAHQPIPIGSWGLVQIQGLDDDCAVTAGAAGVALNADASNAGRLTTMSGTFAATTRIAASSVVAPSGNVGTVLWHNPLGLRATS